MRVPLPLRLLVPGLALLQLTASAPRSLPDSHIWARCRGVALPQPPALAKAGASEPGPSLGSRGRLGSPTSSPPVRCGGIGSQGWVPAFAGTTKRGQRPAQPGCRAHPMHALARCVHAVGREAGGPLQRSVMKCHVLSCSAAPRPVSTGFAGALPVSFACRSPIPFRSPCHPASVRSLFRAYRLPAPARVGAGAVRAPDCPRMREPDSGCTSPAGCGGIGSHGGPRLRRGSERRAEAPETEPSGEPDAGRDEIVRMPRRKQARGGSWKTSCIVSCFVMFPMPSPKF